MAGSLFEPALAHYSARLSMLEQAAVPLAPECVLAVLVARDAVHAALQDHPQVPAETLLLLTQCDDRLRQHTTKIAQAIDLTAWRDSFHPPPEAWWWFVSSPARPQRWDRFDWLWNIVSVVCLAMALSLVVDISGRFLRDGPDTLVVHPLKLHTYTFEVIPAQAGIQSSCQRLWIPAFAGMTSRLEASSRYVAQLNG